MSTTRARSATIFDVARLAGVSHQTVSRVVNDLPNVRPSTRDKVEVAIRQLQYVPSSAARALVTRRSRTIGVVNTGSADFGPASIANALMEAAAAARYAVIVSGTPTSGPASIRDDVERLLRQNVEAIVLIAARTDTVEALVGVQLDVPLVAVESGGRSGFHSVSLDQYAGARIAVRHLIENGHRAIVHLAGPADSLDALERVRGWRDELGENGLAARAPRLGDWTPASGAFAADALLAEPRDFTAVFVANDQMALGLTHAFGRAGVVVPDDVSVVGFDDIPESAFFTPPLTTIRQDFDALGRQIMERLLVILHGDALVEIERYVPTLVERESVRRLV